MENVIEDLLENNKMIAEFCGFKKHHEQDWYLIPKGFSEHISHNWQSLLFHKSFDWLMPVVQKIEKLGYDFTINSVSGVQISEGTPQGDGGKYYKCIVDVDSVKLDIINIETLYAAVIEFIKWYDLQNTTPTNS